jgi:IS5 family transposase
LPETIQPRKVMREKIVTQPELDFQPSSLKVTNAYFAKYELISRILDENPKIIDLVHREIGGALTKVTGRDERGRPFKYTTDTVIRILVCQAAEGLSLRNVVIRIDDSHYLRRFIRIDSRSMMDFTTLDKLKNQISTTTWKKVNLELAKHAVREGLIAGASLRIDTTAVETNIHWPTDASLLWDVYRVLARLIEQARELDATAVGNKRLRLKRAKKLASSIARFASNKSDSSRKKVRRLHRQLIDAVEGLFAWCISVGEGLQEGVRQRRYDIMEHTEAQAIIDELKHYRGLGLRVVDQARRRVLEGQQVPNEEKIFSIFEPHTELLKRGKQGKSIEFGHMVQFQQVAGKFITDYDVFEKRPNEKTLLEPALESHKQLFNAYPHLVTADKGYSEEALLKKLRLEKKVELVAIAKKGKRTPEEIEREHAPEFKDAQRFRAGIEGTISFIKRVLGLFRCFSKGWGHFCATVGMTVFAHNLLSLART